MIDYELLRSEIDNDPLSLGYASLVARGSDQDIANILNDKEGAGKGNVNLEVVDLADFLVGITPALIRLSEKEINIQTKWDRLLGVIKALPVVRMNNTLKSMLNAAVSDGIMTQPELNAIGVVSGSRAEVLFGKDVNIQHIDVAKAFGRGLNF